MTQKEAFELIKQTVKECKGSLKDIFICVTLDMYHHENCSEEVELHISVTDSGSNVCRTETFEEAVAAIKSYYSAHQTTVTPDGEIPKLAS